MNLNINDIFKKLLPVIIYILLYFLITKALKDQIKMISPIKKKYR